MTLPFNQKAGQAPDYVHWFRHSSPYINAHRGKTFVIYLPGQALTTPEFDTLIHDISLLNSLGVKLVLVHGANHQIDQAIQEQAQTVIQHQGHRVIESEHLPTLLAAVGQVRATLEAKLSTGLINSPMSGACIRVLSGNFVTAQPLGILNGEDLHYSGKVRRIDRESIQTILAQHAIVLLSPMGYSPTGEIFSLSAQEVASECAMALDADKLIFFSRYPTSIKHRKLLAKREMRVGGLQSLLQTWPPNTPLFRELNHLADACRHGIQRNHLLDYTISGTLLMELFSLDGSGLMISNLAYEGIRQANIEDIGAIIELISPLEEAGQLIRRSREKLEREIGHFSVIEKDGMLIGCSALYTHSNSPQSHLGEIACIAIHPDYRNGGRGTLLLRAMEEQAQQQDLQACFVLTTQTAHWFLEQGFIEQALDSLPLEKKHLYNAQRKSKIFIKTFESVA